MSIIIYSNYSGHRGHGAPTQRAQSRRWRSGAVVVGVAVVSLWLTGCFSTHYKSVTREPNGIVTERDLRAWGLAVKRDIGPVKLGNDSLGGAKTDQAEIAQLLGEALLAKVAK